MAIAIMRVEIDGAARWGVARDDLLTLAPEHPATTRDFLAAFPLARLMNMAGPTVTLADLRLLPPITADAQFICQGANYRGHMIESGMDPDAKTFNMIFTKAPGCIVAADADVPRPPHVMLLDYEIELGLVLARDIDAPLASLPDPAEMIAGLVIVNDYSARDVQLPQMQFYKGKSYRGFGPVGPSLVLLEPGEFARLGELRLTLSVDGVVRQDDYASGLVFGPAETLLELSGVHALRRGDLIATGTPAGCAFRAPSKLAQKIGALIPERIKWRAFVRGQLKRPYLQPGQRVEARIATADGTIDLGVQRNRIVAG